MRLSIEEVREVLKTTKLRVTHELWMPHEFIVNTPDGIKEEYGHIITNFDDYLNSVGPEGWVLHTKIDADKKSFLDALSLGCKIHNEQWESAYFITLHNREVVNQANVVIEDDELDSVLEDSSLKEGWYISSDLYDPRPYFIF